jgi:dihydroflavonol-4-reductase
MRQERVARRVAREQGVDLVSACPTLAVGSFDFGLATSNAVIVKYLNDPFRATFPGGCNVVAARDVARGHITLAEKGQAQEAYLLSSDNLEWAGVHRIISEICHTVGPLTTATHTSAYLTAAYCEAMSQVTHAAPALTRAEVRMMGRYYWYDDGKARALGYAPVSTREAIEEAVRWLVRTEHLHPSVRASIHLESPRDSVAV